MVVASTKAVRPKSGEQYRNFVLRAHKELMPSIPAFEARNKAVWDAWDKSNGNPVREAAQKYHAKACSRFVPDVCYFMEHETTGSDGLPVKYGFNELADICEEMNGRCDTHNYSAISDRHTIRGMVPDEMQPKVVGYTGAARLGMIGNQNPKWALFMDEHHLKDGISVLNQKKRRSVEVNRFRDGRTPYIDPIAALGADSPRLPLPVAQYATDGDPNRIVDTYEAPMVGVGAGNAFIPSMGSKRVDQYEDMSGMDSQYSDPGQQQQAQQNPIQGQAMTISPDDVKAIVQALFQTPEFQFVQQLMQQQNAGAQPAQPGMDGQQATQFDQPGQSQQFGGNDQDQDDMQADFGQQQSQQQPPSQQPSGGSQMANNQQQNRYSNEDQVTVDQYQQLVRDNEAIRDQYQQLLESNRNLLDEIGTAHKAIAQLEARAVDGEREAKLKDLYAAYPHFIDLAEERETCLYSLGAEMSNEAFDQYVTKLEKMAKRSSPTTQMIPGSDNGSTSTQYSNDADLEQAIKDRYTDEANRGNVMKYAEVKALVLKERGQV